MGCKIQGLWSQKVTNSIISVKGHILWLRAGFAPGEGEGRPPADRMVHPAGKGWKVTGKAGLFPEAPSPVCVCRFPL